MMTRTLLNGIRCWSWKADWTWTFVLGKVGGTGWKGPRGMEGFCSYFYWDWQELLLAERD